MSNSPTSIPSTHSKVPTEFIRVPSILRRRGRGATRRPTNIVRGPPVFTKPANGNTTSKRRRSSESHPQPPLITSKTSTCAASTSTYIPPAKSSRKQSPRHCNKSSSSTPPALKSSKRSPTSIAAALPSNPSPQIAPVAAALALLALTESSN